MSPIIFFKIFWKFHRNKNLVSILLNKFFGILGKVEGIESYKLSKQRVWIHAVSVGETHAAIPLIRELIIRNSENRILLTNTTLSGFNFFKQFLVKHKIYGEKVSHCFCPIDFTWAIKVFLDFTKPHIVIFIETEIWPNLINELYNRKIKIVLANGRLSENTLAKYQKFSLLSKPIINKFSLILAQGKSDAKRFIQAGVKVKVVITGNTKFDSIISQELVELGIEWKRMFPEKSVWLASSTRRNEEKQIFEVWAKNRPKQSLLVVVPRHPERFDWVFAQARNIGFKVMRRSEFLNKKLTPKLLIDIDVLIGDSMGEIAAYASLTDLALIGGSVIDCGGQSPIELSSQLCPVFFGPFMTNFYDISNQLNLTEAGYQVHSYEEWINSGLQLITDQKKFLASKKAAGEFVSKNKGASKLSVNMIQEIL